MPLDAASFINVLIENGVSQWYGIPDSLLSALSAEIYDRDDLSYAHSSNEGASVSQAIGYNLATNQLAAVFLQNSGLGNCINPLTSLAHPKVYGIPMLLCIGWRGQVDSFGKQLKDEPQHVHQGAITLQQLQLLEVPYLLVEEKCEPSVLFNNLSNLIVRSRSERRPVAIVFQKQSIIRQKQSKDTDEVYPYRRIDAIKTILSASRDESITLFTTTGFASREANEIINSMNSPQIRHFMCIGGMGHCISIAESFSKHHQGRVICIDGDGSLLMHFGSLLHAQNANNLLYVLINNFCHDSVGGQSTIANRIDFTTIAQAAGYKTAVKVHQCSELEKLVKDWLTSDSYLSTQFIEFQCNRGTIPNLTRPALTPYQNLQKFSETLY